jgi:malonyl-CoA O-methyltransferase
MQAEEAAMRDLMPPLAGRNVLDLASGTGRYGLLALEQGAVQVIGSDNSFPMLRENCLPQRILAEVESIPLPSESIDVVLCGLALGHLPRLESSMFEIARVLKAGGLAVISDFHPFLYMNGQKRTFAAPNGKVYAVEHYAHLYADYHRAAKRASLHLEDVIEPKLGAPDRDPANRSRMLDMPVVIAYRFRKGNKAAPLG